MSKAHLNPVLIEKLLRNELDAQDVQDLVWHLLDTCPSCAEAAMTHWPVAGTLPATVQSIAAEDGSTGGAEVGESPDYDRLWEKVAAAEHLIEIQRRDAVSTLDEILTASVGERQKLVDDPRFHTLPLIEAVVEHAWSSGLDRPAEADELIGTSLELADRLTATEFGAELVEDLKARALAYRGNFRRIMSDYRGAEEAFDLSESHLSLGTGDLLERAKVLDLRASLRARQERYDDAEQLVQQAITLYLGTNEAHLGGRSMINLGAIARHKGEHERAIELWRDAVELIDALREPRLVLCAQTNVLNSLCSLGRYDEASAMLPKTRRLASEVGTRFDLLRLRWSEGRVLDGLGHEDRAEAAYLEVRKGFTEAGVGYEAALVSLDLAALYARQTRTDEMKRLAEEMLPIFQSRDVHHEAMAALVVLREALEMETASMRVVHDIASYLWRARNNPQLRFEPSLPV